MRPRSHAFGAALLFSFGLAPTVVAVGEGRVIGTVIDEAGSPLGGVKLLISSPDFKYRQEKATDARGTFSAIILDAARKYTVRLEKEGYTPYEGPLEVKIEETMRLSFVLSKEAAPLASPMGGASDDALVTLERRKWDPQAFSSRAEFVALFADDFVSVGDGIDISGGVQRKTKAEVFAGPPHSPAKFELSDFRVVHPNSDAAIVSYRATATSFAWKAYVTSVWARRQGTWTTVFYQASPAK